MTLLSLLLNLEQGRNANHACQSLIGFSSQLKDSGSKHCCRSFYDSRHRAYDVYSSVGNTSNSLLDKLFCCGFQDFDRFSHHTSCILYEVDDNRCERACLFYGVTDSFVCMILLNRQTPSWRWQSVWATGMLVHAKTATRSLPPFTQQERDDPPVSAYVQPTKLRMLKLLTVFSGSTSVFLSPALIKHAGMKEETLHSLSLVIYSFHLSQNDSHAGR